MISLELNDVSMRSLRRIMNPILAHPDFTTIRRAAAIKNHNNPRLKYSKSNQSDDRSKKALRAFQKKARKSFVLNFVFNRPACLR